MHSQRLNDDTDTQQDREPEPRFNAPGGRGGFGGGGGPGGMGGGYGGPGGYGGGGGGMGGNDRQLYVSNVGSIQLPCQRIEAANPSYSCLILSDGKISRISSGKQVRMQGPLSAGL